MDYNTSFKDLQNYYANLLIVQYNGLPKASATIKMLVKLIFINLILLQIRDAFDWKTAIGTQLDIIGKWVGVSRTYNGSLYWNKRFLSYPQYPILYPDDLTSENQHGYSIYGLTYNDYLADIENLTDAYIVSGSTIYSSGWLSATDGGSALIPEDRHFYKILTEGEFSNKIYGWDAHSERYIEIVEGAQITYKEAGFVEQRLGDDDYRILIGLKIIQNNINHIAGEIDRAIYEYFDEQVYTTWLPHQIIYHYPENLSNIINVALSKDVLIAPSGVSITISEY